MQLPVNTKYIFMLEAPGQGFKYGLECFTAEGQTLGIVHTNLTNVDKLTSGSHKLRVSGETRWARVGSDFYMPVGTPKFMREELELGEFFDEGEEA